jgi:hypothetical protein
MQIAKLDPVTSVESAEPYRSNRTAVGQARE